jgi:sigma-B regulation protein RsbU (phosphoserine phosphatase)
MRDNNLKWVRAGHDPGVLYHPCENRFTELKGNGIALGVDAGFQYTEYERSSLAQGEIAVLYTDGIWEAENSSGQRFGKAALFRIIQENARSSADQILKAVLDALNQFRDSKKYQDDVTLIIVKVK